MTDQTSTLQALLDEFFPACTNVHCSWPTHRCIPNEQRWTAERFLQRAQALQREADAQIVETVKLHQALWKSEMRQQLAAAIRLTTSV